MHSLLNWIQDLWRNFQSDGALNLGYWNYIFLAILVAIEGPIATLIGAAAASAGLLRMNLVFLSASAGNLAADALWYSLGYAGKIEWFYRYGRILGVKQGHLDRLKRGMYAHATKILLLAKITAGFIIPTLIAAGLARVPWRRWFPVIAFGELVWTGSLVLIGYYMTESVKQIGNDLRYVGFSGGLLFILVIIWFIRRGSRNKSNIEEWNEQS